MPELPEVRTVSGSLNKEVRGNTIKGIKVFLPKLIKNQSKDMFIKKLKGKRIESVSNYGKFIIFNLSNKTNLVSHLRMEGKYRVEQDLNKGKHDHVIFDLGNKYLIYSDTRQFGTFHYFQNEDIYSLAPLGKMAKEPQETNATELFKRLQRKSIAIKTALLDQTLLVGLGNIYVNEVLWWEKISPTRKSNEITLAELKRLLKRSAIVMDESTEMGGTTIHSFKSFNETSGNYQSKLKVHGKEGFKCFRCKKPILKNRVNGRGTYYCSHCQK